MSGTACLHIRARDTDPIRVVELPGASIRIGRASYCEVRLTEPELAEEECRLRRRGGTWHLIPAQSTHAVWLDGQFVEGSCPLPFDVPFRVGDHWLTLRPNGSVPEWDTYHAPTPVALSAGSTTVLEGFRGEAARSSVVPNPIAEDQTRHTTWQAKRTERPQHLRTSAQARSWEERWKAAGERLKSRAGRSDARPAPVEPKVAPIETLKVPYSPKRPDLGDMPRRAESFEPARVVPANPLPPRARTTVTSAPLLPEAPLPQARYDAAPPRTEPTSPPPEEPAAIPPALEPRPDSGADFIAEPGWEGTQPSGIVGTEASSDEHPADAEEQAGNNLRTGLFGWLGSRVRDPSHPWKDPLRKSEDSSQPIPESDSQERPPEPPNHEQPLLDRDPTEEHVESGVPRVDDAPAAVLPPTPQPTVAEAGPESSPDALHATPKTRASANRTSDEQRYQRSFGRPPWHEPTPFATDTKTWATNEVHTDFDVRSTFQAEADDLDDGRARSSAQAPFPSGSDGRESADDPSWPSAREIFAARRLCVERVESPAPPERKMAKKEPFPTRLAEPATWNPPCWLLLVPALATTLLIGSAGVSATWTWASDARSAVLVGNLLGEGDADPKPLPETLARPRTGWWRSSAASLMPWARYFDQRATADPAQAAEARALLDASSLGSPLLATMKFDRARLPGDDGAPPPLASSLGLSRDVVALAWSGHQWLKAGRKAAALKAYREALEMAARAEPARTSAPAYSDDLQVRRYELPGEALIGGVIRDIVDTGDWSYADWSTILPEYALVPLVAVRLLRERGNPDAEKALASILSRLNAPAPEGTSAAVHLAAQAEALALKSRWTESDERYRQAIDLMTHDLARRSWWINLAEIAQRLNDDSKRQRALEQAQGVSLNDEVSRRASDLLKSLSGRPESKEARR